MTTATTQRSTRILDNATTIATNATVTERALNDSLAGWPTDTPTTPAQPPPAQDTDAPPTITINIDRARADLERYQTLMRRVDDDTQNIVAIINRWGKPRLNDTTIERRLAAADELIWCGNCARHGFRNVRTHGTRCEFCADIHGRFGADPPKALLDIKATRRVYVQDIERHMRGLRKAAKKGARR